MSKSNKIAIIGAASSGLSSAIAHKLVELGCVMDANIILKTEPKTIAITQTPLTYKQVEIIKSMKNGYLIETTKGCSRCAGIHITDQSFKQLRSYGLIERKRFVGNYSIEHQLTKKGQSLTLNNPI